MRQVLVAIFLLLLVITAWSGGCQDRRKDEIPTQGQTPPKDQPETVVGPGVD